MFLSILYKLLVADIGIHVEELRKTRCRVERERELLGRRVHVCSSSQGAFTRAGSTTMPPSLSPRGGLRRR